MKFSFHFTMLILKLNIQLECSLIPQNTDPAYGCWLKYYSNNKICIKKKTTMKNKTKQGGSLNHESRLLLRSHTCAINVILDLIPYLLRWEKGNWPLDDFWPQGCWGHMCDSTQGSLCPSPMKIHQSTWIQWPFLQKLEPKVIDPKMTFDPTSVEVTCVTLPKSSQGTLCPSPTKIHQSMWIQWPFLQKLEPKDIDP